MRNLRQSAREIFDVLESEHTDGRIERFVGKRHTRSGCREILNACGSELLGDSDELRRDVGTRHVRTRRRERPREKSLSARDVEYPLVLHISQHAKQIRLEDLLVTGVIG